MSDNSNQSCSPVCEPCLPEVVCVNESRLLFGIIGALGILFEICLVCYLSRNCRRKDKDKETKEDEERAKFINYFDENNLTLKPSQIEIGPDRLGVGQFAEVRKGTATFFGESKTMHMYRQRLVTITTDNVAIKITFAGKGAEIKLLEEAMRLHKIRHKYVIGVKGVCIRSPNGPLLVMDLLEGNLESYLEKVRNEMRPPISLVQSVRIMVQVAEAVNHLQAHDIIHRDLAARNILITSMDDISRANIKLADFGLARIIPHEADTYKVQDSFLPVTLLPPEVFLTDQFCLKSDIWGFAVFVWEFLMVGTPPNHGKSAAQIRESVLSPYASVRCLPQPVACPDLLYVLLKMCWSLDPSQRPSFSSSTEINSIAHDSPTILTTLNAILGMLNRQPLENEIYLSPTVKEEADRVFPLPLAGVDFRPSDLLSGDDSGYGDSANTSRHSGQFDSVLTENISLPRSVGSPTSPSNYLVCPKPRHRQRVTSGGSESSYEMSITALRKQNESLTISQFDETPLTENIPQFPAPASHSDVDLTECPTTSNTGSTQTQPVPTKSRHWPKLLPEKGRRDQDSSADSTPSTSRYENWYYAQDAFKLAGNKGEELEKPERQTEINTVSKNVSERDESVIRETGRRNLHLVGQSRHDFV